MSATTTGVAAIMVRGLTKQFGPVAALRGLDLEVPTGSVFGFLGPNGSGKTTALSIFVGLSRPTGGEVHVLGLDAVKDGMAVRRRIGFLRQEPRFYGWMTARETLQFTGRWFDLDANDRDHLVDELLDLVDLSGAADRKMADYSGGMRQRLGIAQALMGRPDVLLLDEPTSALDPAGRYEVLQIMARLAGRTTIFYSTHILQDVERVADHVAIISEGQRVLQAPMRDLLAGGRNDLVVDVEGDSTHLLEDLRRQPYVITAERGAHSHADRHRIRLEVTDADAARRSVPPIVVKHDVVFIGLNAERKTLEDVFLAVTGSMDGERETRTGGQ